jgi:hypothetical protein
LIFILFYFLAEKQSCFSDATASLTPVDWAHEFQVIHKATSSIFQNCLDTDSKFVQLTNENRTITYIHNNGLTDQVCDDRVTLR